MDKLTKKKINKQLTLPMALVLAAVLGVILCVFLPYATAVGDRAERIAQNPDAMVYDALHLRASDMKNISIFDFTRLYTTLGDQLHLDALWLYRVFFILLLALPLAAGLFALGRKGIGSIVFAALAVGVFYIQNSDYLLRGVISENLYGWGIAHTLFPAAAVVVLAGSIWMLVKKHMLKKKEFAEKSE